MSAAHATNPSGLTSSAARSVYLADVEGFAYQEIAILTRAPLGTVMSRLHRARRQLRSLLTDYAQDHGLVTTGSAATSRSPHHKSGGDS